MIPIIEVRNMFFHYPDGTLAIKGINLDIKAGEFIALIGQNGAGKTTFAKTLNGLLKPSEGYVKINGIDTKQKGVLRKLVQEVGYVFQNPDHQLFNNEVYKEIAYAPRNINLPKEEVQTRVEKAALVAGLKEEHMDMHPFFLTKGLRQRVSIASILALSPRVIIVDEPTTGQDYLQSVEIMNFLRDLNEKGHTIIIITHEMDIAAKYANRIIALSQGTILLDGPKEEVFSMHDVLAQTFVKPPEVSRMAKSLQEFGISDQITDLDSLWKQYSDVVGT